MLRKINSLIPAFLKALDRQLLLNRPELWATKIHHVAFWGMIGLGLISLRAAIQPINLMDIPLPDNAFLILIIPALLGFVFWGWQVGKFDIEKVHGIKNKRHALRNQFIFGLGALLFAVIPFLYGEILSNKIAESVDKETLIEDINTLNIGMRYFPTEADYNPYNYEMDFKFWAYGKYTLDHEELRKVHIKTRTRQQRMEQIAAFVEVVKKYGGDLNIENPKTILKKFQKRQATFLHHEARDIIMDNISRIEKAQTRTFNFQDNAFRKATVFFVFMMWMMLLVFQKNTTKNFLFSILVGGGGMIAGGILAVFIHEFFHFNGPEPIALLFIGAFVLLFVQSHLGSNTQKLNIWKNISLNIATAMTPLIPFMVFTLMDRNINDQEGFNMLYIGMIIAFLAWNVIYHPRFVELQSMPKEN